MIQASGMEMPVIQPAGMSLCPVRLLSPAGLIQSVSPYRIFVPVVDMLHPVHHWVYQTPVYIYILAFVNFSYRYRPETLIDTCFIER